jgi:hypothetical protein
VPEIKVNIPVDENEAISEAKLELLKINKRKRRRYNNSFINA